MTPPWADNEAVYTLVCEKLLEVVGEKYLERFLGYAEIFWKKPEYAARELEQDALARAAQGDVAALFDLVRPDNPLNFRPYDSDSSDIRPIDPNFRGLRTTLRSWLSDETWALIADEGVGKIPRPPRPPHRPRLTPNERRATNKIHIAPNFVLQIESILRALYPEQGRGSIRERAILYTAWRLEIEDERVRAYIRRSKSDPHRIGSD
jgi:hypothetical protein